MSIDNLTHLMILVPAIVSRKIDREVIAKICDDLGVDLAVHHILVLITLGENGPSFIHEIGEKLSISRSQMTFSTNRLFELGFIQRSAFEDDRRKVTLGLTLRGQWVIEEISKLCQRSISRKLAQLSESDLTKAEGALETLAWLTNYL